MEISTQVLLHKSFKEISHCSAGMESRYPESQRQHLIEVQYLGKHRFDNYEDNYWAVQGSFRIHLQRPGYHWLPWLHLQVCPRSLIKDLNPMILVVTGAQTLGWWRTSWCAWRLLSPQLTKQRGESLLLVIVLNSARNAPWYIYVAKLKIVQSFPITGLVQQSLLWIGRSGPSQSSKHAAQENWGSGAGLIRAKSWDKVDQLKYIATTRLRGRAYWPRCKGQKHRTLMSRTRWEPIFPIFLFFGFPSSYD